MKTITITEEQARDICFDECNADSPYTFVEELDTDDQGKYQYIATIFSFEGKTYELITNRSGSYFSEYNYSWNNLRTHEVVKKEVTALRWVQA